METKKTPPSIDLDEGLKALNDNTSPHAFYKWYRTNSPTSESLGTLLKMAVEKYGRHDWQCLYSAIKGQQEKEARAQKTMQLVRDILERLVVKNEGDLWACITMAKKLYPDAIVESERVLKIILQHPDVAWQPSVISFLVAMATREGEYSHRWSGLIANAAAQYIHQRFKMEGIAGYAVALRNLDLFAPNWTSTCEMVMVWTQLHSLSPPQAPFSEKEFRDVHDMARGFDADHQDPKDAWVSHFGDLQETIVNDVMSTLGLGFVVKSP